MSEVPRPIPRRLADFEVIRRLGVGGMAEVFLAKKRGAEGTFKVLVLKRVLPQYGESRRFRAMFAEEAQLATRLNHPNIVQVYDFQDYGEEGQLLSMEYVEGPDLRRLMKAARAAGKRIPSWVAAYVVGEIAKGLHYAHERRDEGGAPLEIVHRDVSPQNVLLSFDGAVKIADFGIASANLFREEPGVLKGKTAYMSPEQAAGERTDRRSDIYSLGVVFHEMLTGRPIHAGLEGPDLLDAVRAGRIEPPSLYVREVPPVLESIVMRALAVDRARRYATARELAGEVTRALFQHQELVDAHVLEAVVAELVPRERTSPGLEAAPPLDGSVVAEPGSEGAAGTEARREDRTGPGRAAERPSRARGREVRHVAVLELRLHGLGALEEAIGSSNAARVIHQLRETIQAIAFKRGATWTWRPREGAAHQAPALTDAAHAVLGLLSNPARAAADAAWLAGDVHEAIQGATDDLPVPLSASIGLVRGVASGVRDAAGNLAEAELQEPAGYLARLLGQHAPAGATWVAGGIYRLVRKDFVWGDAPSFQVEDPGEVGLPPNMRLYSLLRPLTREERLRELAMAPSDVVGRDAELADLHAAFHQAVTRDSGRLGRVTARVVAGEMGIGKSALISAFLAELPADARVLRVEASPLRQDLPLGSVGEFIRELTEVKLGQDLEQARVTIAEAMGDFATGRNGPAIVTALAELAVGVVHAAADEAEVQAHRRLVASGLRRFFARAAVEAPLVVIIEGVQWCDRPSLELISALVRRDDPLPLLAILVTRPEERIAPFIEGLVRIELFGLSPENQIRLLRARLSVGQGVEDVCADLLPRAGGNPFFLLEMVDALLERGVLEIREREGGESQLCRVEGRGTRAHELPSTLEQIFADRLDELPPEERKLVEWLAVAGAALSDEDLSALAGGDIEDAAVRLCARGLCDRKGDLLDVRHPLARDVAYLALDRAERVRMHRALGERMAAGSLAQGLTAAQVARHLARGNRRDLAASLYLEAAHAARNAHSASIALRYYRRVVALGGTAAERFEAHEAMEQVFRVQGRWRERKAQLAAMRKLARETGSPSLVATALTRTARWELDGGHLSRAQRSAERAERAAERAGLPLILVQASAITAEAMRDLGDMQGALSACDRALATALDQAVPARVRADVLRTRGTLLRRVGRVTEAIEAHAEAIAICRKEGAKRMEARALNALAFALFVLARYEDAIVLAIDAIRIDLALGGRFQLAKTLSNIGQCHARLGDYARGLAYLRRARDAHERYSDQDSRADTLLACAEVLLELGDREAAEELVRDAGALTGVTSNAYDATHEKILRAQLARAAGDSGAAVMYAFDARQHAEAQAYVAFHFHAMAVEAAARVDIGELHTGILLATTALGAIETIKGSEYAVETRWLCCETLRRAGSPDAEEATERAARFVRSIAEGIRDPARREGFLGRAPTAGLLGREPAQPPARTDLEPPELAELSPDSGEELDSQRE